MALATASRDGRPSVRIVLLKGATPEGFVFFTNYSSRKGSELISNPFGSLAFFWPTLERQVRVEGRVEKVSAKESDDYFKTRPRGSQIGAWASLQSQVLLDRRTLENRVEEFHQQFSEQEVLRPENWGGFRLIPDTIEFWQGKESRLHERVRYTKEGNSWKADLLFP
jgi:pyridoxamine 5'-phosphate oxidase